MSAKFIILIVVVACLLGLVAFLKQKLNGLEEDSSGSTKVKSKYRYARQQYFMHKSEHDFYKTLMAAVGDQYFVFAQVHLPTILDHAVKGQNWKGAFSHINGKSVDFVLCDKQYVSPKLAIELDGMSHTRPDRIERDSEVERMLKEAGMPLLRIKNDGNLNAAELVEKIKMVIS